MRLLRHNLIPITQAQIDEERKIEESRDAFSSRYNLDTDVPSDPQQFYEKLGLIEHPDTREPVKQLTPYQISTWKDGYRYKRRLVVKSQKTGITTSTLMEDFQKCIIPTSGHELSSWSTMGRETLIIAQKFEMAKEHLNTLYEMLISSETYADWIIEKPSDITMGRNRDRTKANMLYIQNPENPKKKTRLIALGPRPSGVWSWKNVKHIHMSDVAAVDMVDDSQLFGAAFSRLANTNGSVIIETPPRGQRGKVWEIYKKSEFEPTNPLDPVMNVNPISQFKVRKIHADEAVSNGIITQDFLDSERLEHGPLYSMLYECEFLNPFTSWYTNDLINYDNSADNVEM